MNREHPFHPLNPYSHFCRFADTNCLFSKVP